jgi:hypothetical protein
MKIKKTGTYQVTASWTAKRPLRDWLVRLGNWFGRMLNGY